MQIFIHLLIIMITFFVLAKVVDGYLIPTVLKIKSKLGLTDDQAGTLISFISSAPELSVGMVALIVGIKSGDNGTVAIAAGTVIGSALFSLLFIVGVSSYFSVKTLSWHSVGRDMAYYLLAVMALFVFLKDGSVTTAEALFLLAMYGFYAFMVSKWNKIMNFYGHSVQISGGDSKNISEDSNRDFISRILSIFFIKINEKSSGFAFVVNVVVSCLFVILSSYFMVESAVALAHITNISDAIISLTILAVGTSIPDFITSVQSAKMGYGDTAISNAVGSNIFDILGNLGLTYLIGSIFTSGKVGVATENLNSSVILLFASAAVLVLIFVAKKFRLGKPISIGVATSYLIYLGYMIYQASKFS